MHIHIDVDHEDVLTTEPRRLHAIRAAAYFLLHAIGDIKDEDAALVPTGTSTTPPAPPVAPAAMAPATGASSAAVSGAVNTSPTTSNEPTAPAHASNVPPPPPPPPPTDTSNSGDDSDDEEAGAPSNVVQGNFPQAGNVPPPPSVNTAAPSESAATANTAGAANGVVSAEVDSAGMPYDGRIHQKAKGKKKDNTWKLIKGIDENIVKAVVAELAARKGAVAPVSLPASGNTVPVPPVSNGAAPSGVPAPPAGASSPVPVPPAPAVGSVGASAYRALIDKITDLTRNQKITAAKVMELCQRHGAPNLMQLNSMPDLVPLVDKDVDAAVLGLL